MKSFMAIAPAAVAVLVTLSSNVLALQEQTAPPALSAESPISIGAQFTIRSEVLNADRNITIYLPASYEMTDRRYPVLYLIDGGVAQDYHPITGLASLASLTGMMREFIVVGVETVQRRYELTSPSSRARDLEVSNPNGGAADFRRYMIDEVRPAIDARFRANGETAIIGESVAGLFIAETFLTTPESFDHYICVSPSMWWDDMGLAKSAPGLLRGHDYENPKSFYLTVADEGGEHREGVDKLVAALTAETPKNLAWWYEPMEGEHHHTIYNLASLRALRLIFAPLPAE